MPVQAIPAGRWVRIIPAAFLMYTIAFIDRNNIAFGFFGMQKDLAIGATASGIAGGIFFFGYLFLQVPGSLLAEKWSAKGFITVALVVWGVCAMATALVHNLTQLLIIRFVLGVVEGGVSPATMILLTKWFPLSERSRANGSGISASPPPRSSPARSRGGSSPTTTGACCSSWRAFRR